jgi:hypothetical protein
VGDLTDAWVFHAGALGDSILIWPFLRALAHRWERVHLVSDGAKARLAAALIMAPGEVLAHDAQHREFTRLWAGSAEAVHPDAGAVFNFLADPGDSPAWSTAASRMFPGADLLSIGPPGHPSRAAAFQNAGVAKWGGVPARSTPSGPVVLHVGAGGDSKRWPMKRWRTLLESLALPTLVLAGEVEAERFCAGEREDFAGLAGEFCTSLDALREHLGDARAFVGADTGPTHLAAQLGLPTLALFGPTDHRVWSPVGPRVRVLHPPAPSPMEWLDPARVQTALEALLA